MARIEKTVFISYRRTDVYTALAVYENLKNQGYDVFFDYTSVSSGDFEQIITSNIRARAHFLIILTPTALDRCSEPGDWVRREIEIAIEEKRNIVPLLFKGFRFGTPNISEILTGKLKNLSRYNGLNVHEDYFGEAMHRLRTQFLNKPLNTVLHPVSTEVRKVVEKEQVAADKALEQIEDVRGLVRQADEKPDKPKSEPESVVPSQQRQKQPQEKLTTEKVSPKPVSVRGQPANRLSIPWKPIAGLAGGLLLLTLCIWGGINLWNSLSNAIPEPTWTSLPVVAATSRPAVTSTPSPTRTMIPPTPTLGIGSTMTGKDGMTLLYVPAGEFTMGSDADDALAECQKYRSDCQRDWFISEEPPHTINLNAFWIDQTEVTNSMYAKCVDADICNPPSLERSYTHVNYFNNPDFRNYPVIYVNWNMAKAYCEWAERRLPTEAEWEKAASWDQNKQEKKVYPWGDYINCSFANYYDETTKSCIGDTSETGEYPNGDSPYGAYDMAGNVYEWVADWFSETYYASSPASNPLGPDSGKDRVQRGGSWFHDGGTSVRSANRDRNSPTYTDFGLGFRCAVSATP